MRAIAAGATAAVLENKKLKAENQKLSNTNKLTVADLSKLTVADLSYLKKKARKAEARNGANWVGVSNVKSFHANRVGEQLDDMRS